MFGRTPSLIVCAALFPIGAAAMSLGRTTSVASLGQALQFRVPIMLESGETILPECIAVDVTHGESRLDRQVLRYTLEPERTPGMRVLSVRTLVPIEELVLQVTVGIGCPPRFTRSYTLFPDPPSVTLAAVPAEPVADAGAQPARGDGRGQRSGGCSGGHRGRAAACSASSESASAIAQQGQVGQTRIEAVCRRGHGIAAPVADGTPRSRARRGAGAGIGRRTAAARSHVTAAEAGSR
jgi:hypothetical protein